MKGSWTGVVLAVLSLVGCGDDEGSKTEETDAAVNDGGRDAAAPATDSAVRDAGQDAAVRADSGSTDAGGPVCGEGRVECNGKCLAEGESEGNCTVVARFDTADLRTVSALTATPEGELFLAYQNSGNSPAGTPSIVRYPASGAAPTTLSTELLNLDGLYLTDTLLYFTTHGERSTVRQRMTGSIGTIPRAGGAPQFLVRDLADGTTRKTATHFYVASSNIDEGLRRYDVLGKNETLLYDKAVYGFEVVGEQVYFIQDNFASKPIMKLSASGGTPSAFGGGRCARIFGADATHLYANCGSVKRIALADGSETVIAPIPKDAENGLFAGAQVYFTNRGITDRSKLLRVAVADGKVSDLATFEQRIWLVGLTVAGSRAYVVLSRLLTSQPGFVVKIDL